jgi:2-methylcitrate dehydratase PrpD
MAGYDPALGNSIFFEKGLHATSIAGTLGAALASAMVYGLEEEEIGHSVAISASMGAGIIEANRTGGTVKRVHCGLAAHAGITASRDRPPSSRAGSASCGHIWTIEPTKEP